MRNLKALISVRFPVETVPTNGKLKFGSKNNDSKSNIVYNSSGNNNENNNNEWKYNYNNDNNNDSKNNSKNNNNGISKAMSIIRISKREKCSFTDKRMSRTTHCYKGF